MVIKYFVLALFMASGCSDTKMVGSNAAVHQEKKKEVPAEQPTEVPEEPEKKPSEPEKKVEQPPVSTPPTPAVEPPIAPKPEIKVSKVDCSMVGVSWASEMLPEILRRWGDGRIWGDGRMVSSLSNTKPRLSGEHGLLVWWEGEIPPLDSLPTSLLVVSGAATYKGISTTSKRYFINEKLTLQEACEAMIKAYPAGKITRIENAGMIPTDSITVFALFEEERTSYCIERKLSLDEECRERVNHNFSGRDDLFLWLNEISDIYRVMGPALSQCNWRKAKGETWLNADPRCDEFFKLGK